ncbi:glycine cleavage system aminomethyltransferase GcvT [Streptomyces echinoruber]|uniref:Aminomethyltransferase n=1 Tax=Streptomyces echinoruber TaxID=68898 RepID=A0A918QWY4_9ACTN|nr:glycine cleavage system aminomethyltransferase GcvT [Streptomyces echinoruber]GGZ77259.1 aminomethyltransferase [Streptomyces echinoruber]
MSTAEFPTSPESPESPAPSAAPAPRRTALDALHRSLGATMTDFAGWEMPLRYGSERDEHTAVRTRAGLFDLSHMGEITVTGPQAGALLNYALVGDLAALRPGRARYTMICRADGGILDDLIVYRLAEQEYLVVANAANAQVVLDALTERSAGFDAAVRDDRDAYALLAVQGPESPGILKSLSPKVSASLDQGGAPIADLDGLKYYAGLPGTVAGVPALIARTGYTGEDGFELFVQPEHAVELWQALTAAGEDAGLVPCGLACRDTLRLEAGMPLYGHELSTELTPFDAGLGRVVKFDKEGDFVGREALREAADRARENPPRVLVGLVAEGRRVPRAGYAVTAGGTVIGEVTSGAPSPTLGRPIAMAYVDAAHAAPGTPGVRVDIRGSQEPYEVVALPFYKRQK